MERRMVRICRAGDQLSVSGRSASYAKSWCKGGSVVLWWKVRTLQDVKADTAQLVDVGVEDLGEEADLGRGHGVVVGKEQLELEGAACSSKRGVSGVCNVKSDPGSLACLGMGKSQARRW